MEMFCSFVLVTRQEANDLFRDEILKKKLGQGRAE